MQLLYCGVAHHLMALSNVLHTRCIAEPADALALKRVLSSVDLANACVENARVCTPDAKLDGGADLGGAASDEWTNFRPSGNCWIQTCASKR